MLGSVELGRLLLIVDRGVELQDAADRVVAVCGAPGDVSQTILRQGIAISGELQDLRSELAVLRLAPEFSALRAAVLRVFDYDLLSIRCALDFAFPSPPYERQLDPVAAANGLGAPAARLLVLQDELWERARAHAPLVSRR
jgi:hypothetical protein